MIFNKYILLYLEVMKHIFLSTVIVNFVRNHEFKNWFRTFTVTENQETYLVIDSFNQFCNIISNLKIGFNFFKKIGKTKCAVNHGKCLTRYISFIKRK